MANIDAGTTELPDEIDLDGYVCPKGVEYWGKAKRQPDGTYQCVARVGDCLCIVEVRISQPS